eukprot:g34512.t1
MQEFGIFILYPHSGLTPGCAASFVSFSKSIALKAKSSTSPFVVVPDTTLGKNQFLLTCSSFRFDFLVENTVVYFFALVLRQIIV